MSYCCLYQFPDPTIADPNGDGLIAFGGDLAAETLICAYQQGIFPWFMEGEPIAWWSPDPRCIIYPKQFMPSKSLKRRIKNCDWTITVNRAFGQVIEACADVRAYANDTWISSAMIDAYQQLHQRHIAYSIEVWQQQQLIGGLYGLKIGQAFFGESMFHRATDASKTAFFALMRLCDYSQFEWVDCQLPTEHLFSLGACTIDREDFLPAVKNKVAQPSCDWALICNRPVAADTLLLDNCLEYHNHQLRWIS